jgi:hypothetical protein
MICSRPTPAGRCPRGQARARRRQHIAGSLCPSYTGLSAESASTRARLAHGTYSLRQRCAQLAVRDSSGPMLVGRRAAGSQSDQRTCCAWCATRYPGGLGGSVVGILFLRELWHRLLFCCLRALDLQTNTNAATKLKQGSWSERNDAPCLHALHSTDTTMLPEKLRLVPCPTMSRYIPTVHAECHMTT